ncbi:MAG TPA: MBL fold metallo-hydrolase [Chthoniobacter sp.]|jgi:glyoxylase-like metal-dependent hydrolase (beta-lactamase superfamily II)/rhodanese-related sulfurtransferase
MFEKRFYVTGLAHASYLFGANGEAAVVDPKRDVDDYIESATAAGLKIVAIFNSHPHADFVSGYLELAERTGARIYVSHRAPVTYPHTPLHDGEIVHVGSLEVVALETPGHSPDSLSFLVHEESKPVAVFTGDTLFVGDIGRIDLRDREEKPSVLAEALYDSLFAKLFQLPENVRVLPAHGAGSLCGRSISNVPFSSIGQELRTNWAAQLSDRTDFIARAVANVPDRPAYFAHAVETNLRGASSLAQLPAPRSLSGAELEDHGSTGGLVLDLRSSPLFGAGHFPKSLHFSLDLSLFSTWVGFFVPPDKPLALVVEHAADATRAQLELARIGFDQIAGFILADDLPRTEQTSQLSAADLREAIEIGTAPRILDVRTVQEWREYHIDRTIHIPLPALLRRLDELPKGEPMAIICGAGSRSSIAASLLLAQGVRHLQNVMGGMAAFRETERLAWHPADLVFMGENI